MADDSFGARALRTVKRLLVTTVVVGLAGLATFLAAQLNARTFTLELHDGKLWVMKGRSLPFGSEPYAPTDAQLAQAYAPLDLEGSVPTHVTGRRFTSREELDRMLFEVIEGLARPRVASDDPKTLERGLYFLRRAERLAGLTTEQQRTLASLQAEVAYYVARSKLEEAQRIVTQGLDQLRVAAQGETRHARSAHLMLLAVEPPSRALDEALRRAVHSLSAPAPAVSPAQAASDAGTAPAPTAPEGSEPPAATPP